ncbi:hypothetical protein [Methylocystis heyeri]|uniref:Uncharacterized protein n=1 Tax=Methylocystis heyeri TaxID=391905 RepID=A0A6B8KFI6_9HYPH|nr:hypothetical protein [Methylocystis heyeri]QGM45253.1 hypothetical protein H2LOC_005840 [Methylocystis heyeri]
MKKVALRLFVAAQAASGVCQAQTTDLSSREGPPLPHSQCAQQFRGDMQPSLLALLRSLPGGGKELSSAVTDRLVGDPLLAAQILVLAERASLRQKADIAVGVIRAQLSLQRVDVAGARSVYCALPAADPVFWAMLDALEAQQCTQAEEQAELHDAAKTRCVIAQECHCTGRRGGDHAGEEASARSVNFGLGSGGGSSRGSNRRGLFINISPN